MLLLWFQNSTSNDISIWVTLILKKKSAFSTSWNYGFPNVFLPYNTYPNSGFSLIFFDFLKQNFQFFFNFLSKIVNFSWIFLSKIFNFSLTFLNIIILSLYIAKNLKWNSGIIIKIKHFVWSSKTRAIIFTLYFMTTQMTLYIDCAPKPPMDKYHLCS